MSSRVDRNSRHPLIKSAILSILAVFLAAISHTAANQQSREKMGPMEQVTLSPDDISSGSLIPDSEKKHRLHAPRDQAASRSDGAVSIDKIRNFIRANGIGRQTPIAAGTQSSPLRTLTGEDGREVGARVLFDRKNGTPRMIKIQKPASAPSSGNLLQRSLSVGAADQFLRANRQLLKIHAPDEEFSVKKKWTDNLGAHHIRYQQRYQDLPVWGREILVHMDGANQVYLLQGRFEPTPQKAEKVFRVDERQALQAAFNHMGIAEPDARAVKSLSRVWYCLADGRLVSAYAIEVQPDLLQNWIYFIDAETCAVLHRISQVNDETVTSSASDLHGDTQTFTAWREPTDNVQYLVDPTMPLDNPPYAPMPMQQFGNTYILDARHKLQDIQAYYFSGPDWDPAAVSMAFHIGLIHTYWKDAFGRNGIDDNHKNNILIAHVGENHANAFWNDPAIFFGDGDGKLLSNLAGSLDVTAHEYTHGVIRATANLIYENQSGALNEAFADIFACMVDRHDWIIGEDITLVPPFHIRNLIDPSDGLPPLPSKMSEYENLPIDDDHGGVHINCGIPARAAYLVAEGLSVQNLGTSIGREKTEQIFYRALTVYLTQTSMFVDAREATIQAAQDLYGAAEAGAVQAAWDAVEVFGDGPPPSDPTPTDTISGEDIMVYLRPVDSGGQNFDVYVQQISDPFPGSDPSLVTGPLNDLARASYMRPSAITKDDETVIFYVGTDHNLYAVDLQGGELAITDRGDIHSMAISPDAQYFAFTREDFEDNHIYLGNLNTMTLTSYELVSPSTAPGDVGIQNSIMFADSLSFDYTSSTLIFDAYNKMAIGSSNDEYTYWSIGCLDLNSGQLSWPFPGQNPNYDIGNASFAYNNSFIVAFDVINYATSPADTWVWTMDLSDQTIRKVAASNPGNYEFDVLVCGVPSFWGDDDAITMQIFDRYDGSLAYKVPLDQWEGLEDEAVQLNADTLVKPLMHRVGTRRLEAGMASDKQACSFTGNDPMQQVVISNSGNRDLHIYNIGLVGPGKASFRHDGVNGLLPRGQNKTIKVFFEPASDARGTQAATLVIHSDADTPMLEISLTGDTGSDDSGGGGGGGCFIFTTAH